MREPIEVPENMRSAIADAAMGHPEVRQRIIGFLEGKGIEMGPGSPEWRLVVDSAHFEEVG